MAFWGLVSLTKHVYRVHRVSNINQSIISSPNDIHCMGTSHFDDSFINWYLDWFQWLWIAHMSAFRMCKFLCGLKFTFLSGVKLQGHIGIILLLEEPLNCSMSYKSFYFPNIKPWGLHIFSQYFFPFLLPLPAFDIILPYTCEGVSQWF